jgi:hypothetical protein
MRTEVGLIEIALEYSRAAGPHSIHGALRLRLNSTRPYSFRSEAQWPDGVDYTVFVREAVEAVLIERLGSLSQTEVVLRTISFDPVNSCAEGFRRAARAAVEPAFSV